MRESFIVLIYRSEQGSEGNFFRLLYNYVKGKSCGEKLMVHLSDNFAKRDEPSKNESE